MKKLEFDHYVYGADPDYVPWELADEPIISDAAYRRAGFNPDDEECSVGRLTREYDGHPAGTIVVSGLTVSGHPFAIARA